MDETVNNKNNVSLVPETDLLGLIQQISCAVQNAGSEERMIQAASGAGQLLANQLDCTVKQAVLFSIVFSLSFNSEYINIADLANFIGCEPIHVARDIRELEELVSGRLLRCIIPEDGMCDQRMNNLRHYSVPSCIFQSICEKNSVRKVVHQSENTAEMLEVISELMNTFYRMEIGFQTMKAEINSLIRENTRLPFSQAILEQKLSDTSLLIILQLCLALSAGEEQLDLAGLLKQVIPDVRSQISLKRQIRREQHELFTRGLICFVPGAFKSESFVRLTEQFAARLFEGEQELLDPERGRKNTELVLHEIIPDKKMFYSGEEERNLQFLEQALMPSNYERLMKKLREKGLPQGVNILFYGPPGTGKTESVLQLARRTGRDIRQIDISETKSAWFGESEKVIKKVFDKYRTLVQQSKAAPILFFNEADGIFSKRKANGRSSTDQTENAIQNIILQEMETLSGILIATTNMEGNLDKAFERRFLYKILFEKPDIHARFMIWETRLPELETDFIRYLAGRFEFTGGQIDNIVRKHVMHQVIKDEEPDTQDIIAWCREENLQEGYKSIGFRL